MEHRFSPYAPVLPKGAFLVRSIVRHRSLQDLSSSPTAESKLAGEAPAVIGLVSAHVQPSRILRSAGRLYPIGLRVTPSYAWHRI